MRKYLQTWQQEFNDAGQQRTRRTFSIMFWLFEATLLRPKKPLEIVHVCNQGGVRSPRHSSQNFQFNCSAAVSILFSQQGTMKGVLGISMDHWTKRSAEKTERFRWIQWIAPFNTWYTFLCGQNFLHKPQSAWRDTAICLGSKCNTVWLHTLALGSLTVNFFRFYLNETNHEMPMTWRSLLNVNMSHHA